MKKSKSFTNIHRASVRAGGTGGMPPIDFWQWVAAIRPEVQSLDPSLNICLSEMDICENSEQNKLLHSFTHVEIALKAQITGMKILGEVFTDAPQIATKLCHLS